MGIFWDTLKVWYCYLQLFGFCLVSNIQYNTSIYLLTSIKRNFENICKVLLTKLDHFQTSPSLRCSHGSGGPTQTGGGGGGGSNLQSILSLSLLPPHYDRGHSGWLSVSQIFTDKYQQTTSMLDKEPELLAVVVLKKTFLNELFLPSLPS